ncbi:MAG: hypothetical protein DRO06_00135 [Thermoproteota archaeon]|nr:MAG: hypothetical protein DRO06_00135 [Candidatus Korarchaeota archaeon]
MKLALLLTAVALASLSVSVSLRGQCMSGLTCVVTVTVSNQSPEDVTIEEVTVVVGGAKTRSRGPVLLPSGSSTELELSFIPPPGESGLSFLSVSVGYRGRVGPIRYAYVQEPIWIASPKVDLGVSIEAPDSVYLGDYARINVSYRVDAPESPDRPRLIIIVNGSIISNETVGGRVGRLSASFAPELPGKYVVEAVLSLGSYVVREREEVSALSRETELRAASAIVVAAEDLLDDIEATYLRLSNMGLDVQRDVPFLLGIARVELEEAKEMIEEGVLPPQDLLYRSLNISWTVRSQLRSVLRRAIEVEIAQLEDMLSRLESLGGVDERSISAVREEVSEMRRALGEGGTLEETLRTYMEVRNRAGEVRAEINSLMEERETHLSREVGVAIVLLFLLFASVPVAPVVLRALR